jgi:dipeptidyl aminopeptidase/acylaminoacyl peptidase
MRHLFLIQLFFVVTFSLSAQEKRQRSKPPIDSSVYRKWIWVSGAIISNDGHYASYTINNEPLNSKTVIIQSTIGDWKEKLSYARMLVFSENSKQAVFLQSADSLCLLSLGSNERKYISNINSFQLLNSFKGEWLIYQLKSAKKQLIIQDLASGRKESWDSVYNYWLSDDRKILVTQREEKQPNSTTYFLQWHDLESNITATIHEGEKTSNVYFDETNSQIAFATENTLNKQKSIWYYKKGTGKATLLIDNQSPGIDKELRINGISSPGFNYDGTRLFFTLKEKDVPKPTGDFAFVNIWNYKDDKLQSQQLKELSPQIFLATIDIEQKKIMRLAQKDEFATFNSFILIEKGKYGLVGYSNITPEEKWQPNKKSNFLFCAKNGKRLFEIKKNFSSIDLSPDGAFVVYYDKEDRNYFSYELASGITRNLTKGIVVDWLSRNNDEISIKPYSLAGWLVNNESVFVYDQYDIWQLDLSGNKTPLNFTNGFGRKHSTVFRFTSGPFEKYILHLKERLIISAFDLLNKNNGFFSKYEGEKGDPQLLTMGPFLYNLSWEFIGEAPRKARNANAWILTRQTANESPNYFFTTDFKNFTQLSSSYPEKDYNWLKAELHSWKNLDGQMLQGVMYKPENFDSNKKYPIIFHYYEKISHRLHLFMKPEPSSGDINIPFYVSNGYLVFEPDINYKIGHPGASALNSVISAAKYLSKLRYVNSNKMGIQGMSFGGFETNYIVTHSKIFSAACSSAGGSNFLSYYDNLLVTGTSQQIQFENGQYRMGFTLWERPDLYINNSPVLNANKVTAPLLIMHTSTDAVVPFTQAIEFFTALRRLQKKVWMLEYTDYGNHGVYGKSADDFTIRMSQFFDHYLKDKPAPIWMTKGLPARLKGIETGLDFEAPYF